MSNLTELRNGIAASLFMLPCKERELLQRDFLEHISPYGVQICIQRLEQLGAVYYRGEVICIKKKWAKKNLQEYDL